MKAYVITVSDKGSQGLREDTAGVKVNEMLKESGYDALGIKIIPDEQDIIIETLNSLVDKEVNLIVTVGGTGFSKRDVTPEATRQVIQKEAPGLSELMRIKSLEVTPKAMLSRAVCGISNDSLIVNLPGSKKAAQENLEAILPILDHGLKILLGKDSECGN